MPCSNIFSQQTIHFYGTGQPTLYEILNVKKDCTAEEIREAFIKLSKEFHPDTKGGNTNPKDTAKFVQMSNAYQILSKAKSRDAYDQELVCRQRGRNTIYDTEKSTEGPWKWNLRPDLDPSTGPFYGVKGLKKVSNGIIATVLFTFVIVGVGLGALSLRRSININRSGLDKTSKKAVEHHKTVRKNAEQFGNQEQLNRMINRLPKTP